MVFNVKLVFMGSDTLPMRIGAPETRWESDGTRSPVPHLGKYFSGLRGSNAAELESCRDGETVCTERRSVGDTDVDEMVADNSVS